jgi:hypothetical protein
LFLRDITDRWGKKGAVVMGVFPAGLAARLSPVLALCKQARRVAGAAAPGLHGAAKLRYVTVK